MVLQINGGWGGGSNEWVQDYSKIDKKAEEN